MIGRILRSADFERVLGTPIRARSIHFAVHYLASAPSKAAKPRAKQAVAEPGADAQAGAVSNASGPVTVELSTASPRVTPPLVDESLPAGIWMGYVVPKRHAKRAVTRTLLKHQIRHAVDVQVGPLPCTGLAPGLWVVRLRSPFDRKIYPSASSEALRDAAAIELQAVMADAARRVAR